MRAIILFIVFPSLAFAQHTLTIGAIASLSGPAAEQGRNWLDGAQLAVEELQAEGQAVRFFIEDDATSAAKANAAFKKLVSVDAVQAIVGGTWDFTAEAVFPLAADLQIPFVTPSNPVELFSDAARSNKYVFTNGLSIEASKEALSNFLKDKHPRSIAIIVPKLPFGVLHVEMLQALAQSQGIKIVLRDEFEYGGYHSHLRTLALKLSLEKPEMVFCIADYGALDVFVSEMEKFRFNPLLLTVQHLDEAIALSKNVSRYRNSYGIYPSQPSQDFLERFEMRYHKAPKVFAAEGYDALRFLASMLANKVDISKPGFSYRGVTGKHTVKEQSRALSDRSAVVMHLSLTPFLSTRDPIFL